MAFHVACPITCRLLCDCELGFPEELRSPPARKEFEEQAERLEEFLRDPWIVRDGGGGGGTVQVLVPKVVPAPAPPPPSADVADHGGGGEDALSSAQARRAALQRQAAAASMAAEDYVRRLETGGAADIPGEAANNLGTEDQGSLVKVICRICFSGENEGSERAMKMLSCKFCNKKYHRSCLKVWAEYRDLFHWSSWACPSCRICEVCRRAGDPTKLMFCKRCDGAYHCYCQQPPHKNVSHGPYLCPKHTRCHSCGSTVPGSGLSTRWFLGYTCCDACGRLFVKGKYCPVCLKVYRDSEMTPMVCCDACEQWVHCVCDGISDEKYQQFQADGNLYYKCPACRGDCYRVKDMEDAVRELWRRRDKADRDLTANLRAAAGLPTQEEIFSICPYSDDDEAAPVIPKNDYGSSSKFSVKGLTDKSSKNSKELGKSFSKKSSNKKYIKKGNQVQFAGKPGEPYQNTERQHELRSLESSLRDTNFDETKSYRNDAQDIFSSPLTRSPGNDKGKSSVDHMGSNNHMFIEEVVSNNFAKMPKVHIKGSKSPGLHVKEGAGKNSGKTEMVKGTKLVIHIGAKNRNAPGSPKSEASSCHKDQDVNALNGSEGMSQLQTKSKNYVHDGHPVIARNHDGKGAKLDNSTQIKSARQEDRDGVKKLQNISETHRKSRAINAEECEPMTARRSPLIIRKTSTEVDPAIKTRSQTMLTDNDDLPGKISPVTVVNFQSEIHNVAASSFGSNSSNDPKPLLKLKFKNPYFEQRSSWAPSGGEEKNPVKGQRSKRKRPSIQRENNQVDGDDEQPNQEDPIDVVDANWILQKLGKDVIGKRVEVHEASENSWHKGVVSNVLEGTSSLSVRLDDGRSKTLELGRQTVRFISQKHKKVEPFWCCCVGRAKLGQKIIHSV
uniref:Uncharacterized protein LOC105046515 isoform X2 n=1 Tax=Elaeis guineensis var. tenera TaxID=51953 RepID=A0A6I9RB51_ELAGV|nr:uncharacterized protein LOC105046515 isoform X2 [Elaeis guineensis]